MPIILESSEVQASTGFNIQTALFGDDKPDKKSISRGSLDHGNKELSVGTAEGDEELDTRAKIRRKSSMPRSSLSSQSSRKMSTKQFDSESQSQHESHTISSQEILKNLQDKHAQMETIFNKSLETNRDKLLKLGSSTVDKTGKPKSPATMEALLDQMNSARVVLSKTRQKLLSNLRERAHLKLRDRQLEDRYEIKIRRENLSYLQVEVSLTGEKIDEIIKQVALAKSQYESDLSKVVHVREKWCAVQNELHNKLEDLNEVREENEEHQEYLGELWQRKKELRKENAKLKKECRIIDNEPLLRKYDRVVQEIEQITNYKKKFEEL